MSLLEILSSSLYRNHLEGLKQIIINSQELLEGNCTYLHNSNLTEHEGLTTKKFNLLKISQNTKTILEIGFNAGHSCLLFLLSNTYSKITLLDLNDHSYTQPCFEYLNKHFPNRLFIIYGDSNETAKQLQESFDLIHIDGGHSYQIAKNDINNCKKLSNPSTLIILDDIDFEDLSRLFNELLNTRIIKQVSGLFLPTTIYPHILFQFV